MSNVLTRRIFFIVVSLLTFSTGRAQEIDARALSGTWELRAIEMRGKFSTPDYLQWNVFGPDGSLNRITVSQPLSPGTDTIRASGTWELKGDELVMKLPGHIPDADSAWVDELSFRVRSLSDSSLVLSGWNGKIPQHMHYHKVNDWVEKPKRRPCSRLFSRKRRK
jgi:hypothetical protein